MATSSQIERLPRLRAKVADRSAGIVRGGLFHAATNNDTGKIVLFGVDERWREFQIADVEAVDEQGRVLLADFRANLPLGKEAARRSAPSARRMADVLRLETPVFYADNVADYWLARRKDLSLRDIPVLTPPFEHFWIEWSAIAPPGAMYNDKPFRVGDAIEVHANRREDGFRLTVFAWYWRAETIYLFRGNDQNPVSQVSGLSQPQRAGEWVLFLDRNGAPVDRTGDEEASAWEHQKQLVLFPGFLAMAFMSCRNVRHVEHEPAFRSGPGWREEKPFRVRHYTLEIDPMREVLRREGGAEQGPGLAQALHICRGHFKDYRQSGLFGKIKGVFWWDNALRGSADVGIVTKDYKVKSPG